MPGLTSKLLPTLALLLMLPRIHAATVVADNEVIQGSLGVGLDTTANDAFGFDTIQLKENNTRITFIDTSAGPGFPNNCWTIVANDSASGGANYLGFRDLGPGAAQTNEGAPVLFRVVAGAPANSLVVASTGKIGFRTLTPALDLHILTTDTPAIRLDQSNAGGFTAQTWDIGGNEANFFVRDTTGGSRLPFRIRPGAPTSSIDIAASGNVGIGTASPTAKLFVKVDPTANEGVIIGNPAVVTVNKATLHVEGTAYIAQTIEIGSSRTRKENIRELTLAEAQAAVRDLKPVQFNYKKDSQTQLGFIAEDVPELVATKNRNSVIPMDFVAVLTKVVQEQQKREDELNATVRAQQELLKKMEARLEKLEHPAR